MKLKQLDRLIDYRRRIERERAVVLREAVDEQEYRRQRWETALEARRQAQENLRRFDSRVAEELRRDHEHLIKTSEVIEHMKQSLRNASQKVDEETQALIEARREVKLVEVLMQRQARRDQQESRRKEQRSNDEFVTRSHYKKNT